MADRVYVALDLETTGFNPQTESIIEVAAVRVEGGRITARFDALVNPQRTIPLAIQQLTGIRQEDVAGAPVWDAVAPELRAFVGPEVAAVVAHNAAFDLGFLAAAGINFHRPALDTVELAAILLPGMPSYNLGELCRVLGISLADAHRAGGDAAATAQLFVLLLAQMERVDPAVAHTLVERGGDSNWSPLMLFADRLAASGYRPEPAQARTDLRARYGEHPLPLPDEPAAPSLLTDEGGPPQPAPPDQLLGIFADDGPLARQMGDAFEIRGGQIEMAAQVMDALNQGDHLLVEAGTGTGKSLAYLAPAALWSVRNQRRVVIATNTMALQEQLLGKDIPEMQRLLESMGQTPPRAALLKGRGNYLCTRRLDEWSRGRTLSPQELSVLARVLVWLPTTETGDVSELFLPSSADRAIWQRICSDGLTCNAERCRRGGHHDFYLAARTVAEQAHLLVVNHALLMADVGTGHHTLPPYKHLVVDETHHLEDVATDQLTDRIVWPLVQRTLAQLTLEGDLLPQLLQAANRSRLEEGATQLNRVARQSVQAAAALRRFAEALLRFALGHESMQNESSYAQRLPLDGAVRSQPRWSDVEIGWDAAGEPCRVLQSSLDGAIRLLDKTGWADQEPQAALLQELRGLADQVTWFIDQMDRMVCLSGPLDHENAVIWLEYQSGRNNGSDDISLVAAPRDVGQALEQALVHQCRSLILTSATLRTDRGFHYIQERLGLLDVPTSVVASPFDYQANTLLYLPTDLPQPNQAAYQRAVEEAVVAAAGAAGGRSLVLFTSHAHLRQTANAVRPVLDRMDIALLQHGASSRTRLLREYHSTDRAVLMGARSFWEGIDLPGEQLSVVIIVRLPFAVPSDPLVAARSAQFDNPFQEYTVPDAVLRFRQGFGRLIRRATDRGVVVILDSRVWQKRYGRSFLDALPECTTQRRPLDALGSAVRDWLT